MDAAWILLVLVAAGAASQPADGASNSSAKPVEHRVYFAGQGNWSGGPTTAPPAVSFDRYGQPITQATQSISDRTQAAITQSGAALKDGFDAGVRATSQQLSSTNPFATTTTAPSATAPTGVSSPWTGNPGAAPPAPNWQSNPAPPGIVATGSNPATTTATTAGWSSIGSSVAAPPLLIPQSPMNYPTYGATAVNAGRSGPGFPAIAASDTQPLHSVLTEPGSSTAKSAVVNRADDLAAGWGDNAGSQQPSIRAGSQPPLGSTVGESNLVPLSGNNTTPQDTRYTNTNRTASGFQGSDGWPQQAQPNLSAQPTIESTAVNRQLPAPPMNNGTPNPAGTNPFASQPPVQQPPTGLQSPQMGNINTISTSPNMSGMGNGSNPISNVTTQKGSATPSDQAWMPLILAVLTLAGSLAANLFLGMSYLDARQKYQSLVRKTADTFRRVKAAAA